MTTTDPLRPASAMDVDASVSSLESASSQKSLSHEELIQHVLKMVKNRERAELIILELMNEYSFDFQYFKELLRDNNLEVSFSRVKYRDIAPKIGLRPQVEGEDIPTFPMFRARITNGLFCKIMEDIQGFAFQYRPLAKQDTEEARSRFLSAFFNKIVALFYGLLYNTPESTLEGRITTKGRIEYQFKVFGGVAVLFIEVKLSIGGLTEHLNCIAQVIAEADACSWMNFQSGYIIPIMAILCDGSNFYFFKFVDRRQTRSAPAQFFLGKFASGDTTQPIPARNPSIDIADFYHQSRTVCESLYYIFLSGYQFGLEANWHESVERAKAKGRGTQLIQKWQNAVLLAKDAIEVAKLGRIQWEENKVEESKKSAQEAVEYVAKSVEEVPWRSEEFFSAYTEELADRS